MHAPNKKKLSFIRRVAVSYHTRRDITFTTIKIQSIESNVFKLPKSSLRSEDPTKNISTTIHATVAIPPTCAITVGVRTLSFDEQLILCNPTVADARTDIECTGGRVGQVRQDDKEEEKRHPNRCSKYFDLNSFQFGSPALANVLVDGVLGDLHRHALENHRVGVDNSAASRILRTKTVAQRVPTNITRGDDESVLERGYFADNSFPFGRPHQ
jgi:hypothetical protein